MWFLAKYLFYVMVGGPPRSENENCNILAVIKLIKMTNTIKYKVDV